MQNQEVMPVHPSVRLFHPLASPLGDVKSPKTHFRSIRSPDWSTRFSSSCFVNDERLRENGVHTDGVLNSCTPGWSLWLESRSIAGRAAAKEQTSPANYMKRGAQSLTSCNVGPVTRIKFPLGALHFLGQFMLPSIVVLCSWLDPGLHRNASISIRKFCRIKQNLTFTFMVCMVCMCQNLFFICMCCYTATCFDPFIGSSSGVFNTGFSLKDLWEEISGEIWWKY
jgi:hypothetical protein